MSTPIQLLPGTLPAGYCWPLFNVLPDATVDDPENADCTNSELPRQFASAYATLCVKLSDFLNLFWSKLRVSMLDSVAHSKLDRSVFSIFCLGSQKQMVGIYTSRIVSIGTIVTNTKAIWNWSVVKFPRKSVSGNHLSNGEPSVASLVKASVPKPASFRFLDVRPKAFGWIQKALSGAIGKSCLENEPFVPLKLFTANTAIGFHCGMLATSDIYRNN